VSAAFGERDFVVDFIGGDMNATFKAILTKRVLGNIQVPNLTPTVVVMFGVAVGSVVLAGNRSFVSGTITLTSNVFEATAVGTTF